MSHDATTSDLLSACVEEVCTDILNCTTPGPTFAHRLCQNPIAATESSVLPRYVAGLHGMETGKYLLAGVAYRHTTESSATDDILPRPTRINSSPPLICTQISNKMRPVRAQSRGQP